MYFATAAGRPLLELIYDAIPTTHTKKEFIAEVASQVETYRFIYVNRESGELANFKPDLANAEAFVYMVDRRHRLKHQRYLSCFSIDHFCYCGLNGCIETAEQIVTTRAVQSHPKPEQVSIRSNTFYRERVHDVDWR